LVKWCPLLPFETLLSSNVLGIPLGHSVIPLIHAVLVAFPHLLWMLYFPIDIDVCCMLVCCVLLLLFSLSVTHTHTHTHTQSFLFFAMTDFSIR
jgi:hypothetical protein